MKGEKIFKQVASIITIVLLLQYISILAPLMQVKAESATVDGIAWTYETDSNGNAVNVQPSNKDLIVGDITIPSELSGHSIVSIGNSAFKYCSSLTSIEIPNSVTSIGEMAFGNNKLSNISIPSSVTSIEVCAFNNNALPDSQAFIYSRNTDGSEDKTTVVSYGGKNKDIRIPDGVTTIGYRSFSNNDLISVTIPSSVTLIKWGAFEKNKLKQVIIKGKSSSKEFTDYSPYSIYWGWASDVTCVKDNTRNVTNGCIIWDA